MGLFGPSRKELQQVQQELAAALAEGRQLAERLTRAEAQQATLEQARAREATQRTVVEGERDALRTERDLLAGERDALQAERDALRQERDAAGAERDRLRGERDAAAGERDVLQVERDALADDLADLRADRDAARVEAGALRRRLADSRVDRPGEPDAGANGVEGSWALVLADLERRWAAGVGALPSARGVSSGPVSAQLAEGLTREVERLREEMGVDVSLTRGAPVEPAHPVTFLLAATDLLGTLAASCERVAVSIDDTLVLTGEVWVELGDDLEVSRTRAVDAGVVIDPIDVGDERVHITLRP